MARGKRNIPLVGGHFRILNHGNGEPTGYRPRGWLQVRKLAPPGGPPIDAPGRVMFGPQLALAVFGPESGTGFFVRVIDLLFPAVHVSNRDHSNQSAPLRSWRFRASLREGFAAGFGTLRP
jgi:hypothetical protein